LGKIKGGKPLNTEPKKEGEMKLKTTAKEMSQYHRIFRVGYCELQSLLKYRSPFAYSCGVYGWNADYYDIDGVLIATGYRSMPLSKNTKGNYQTARDFEARAEGKDFEETEALLKEFIKTISI
jgi:hypothetical protein